MPVSAPAVRVFDPQKLRAARQRLGWSRQDLSVAMNTTYPAISRWENGYADPSLVHTAKLARALGVAVEDLLVDP